VAAPESVPMTAQRIRAQAHFGANPIKSVGSLFVEDIDAIVLSFELPV
jgi:hypothetical protein